MLLTCDINDITQCKESYPASSDMEKDEALNFVPSSMRFFLNKLFVGKHIDKYVSFIGQAIIQRVRPRGLLCPLQIGLGVQMKGMFQSSVLINELSVSVFSLSNKVVELYEKSAAGSRKNRPF